ncbi:MAG: hypothetical protein ABSC23_11445 [Bryobacteraceae bacterium]|jgi:hypothetical protein
MQLTLDTALNLLWLSLSVGALVWLGFREARTAGAGGARLRRFFTLLVVALAIFPAVSDSDDLLSFALLGGGLGQHGGLGSASSEASEKAGLQLVRLLESLEHGQQSPTIAPAPAFTCVASLLALSPRVFERPIPRFSGRAPPAV